MDSDNLKIADKTFFAAISDKTNRNLACLIPIKLSLIAIQCLLIVAYSRLIPIRKRFVRKSKARDVQSR